MKLLNKLIAISLLTLPLLGSLSCEKEAAEGIGVVALTLDELREVEGATQALTVNIKITGSTHSGGEVGVSISGGSYGEDYETSTGASDFTLTVEPNALFANFSIQPIDDDQIEEDVVLNISLISVSGGLELGEKTSTIFTILDDDELIFPTIEFEDAGNISISEADETINLGLLLSMVLTEDASIEIEVDGSSTATLGSDFTINGQGSGPVTVNLLTGTSMGNLEIRSLEDNEIEGDETIVLNLTNPSAGLLLGVTRRQITIDLTDNDSNSSTIDYLETFEAYDGTGAYLTDVLGWQSFIIDQTIDPNRKINLATNVEKFSDPVDITATSDNGLNYFYNSESDPALYGEIDNIVISPLLEGSGDLLVNIDLTYALKAQNAATVTFYYSETYDGSGTFDPVDWTEMGTETAAQMDSEGFGNNDFKREAFEINTSTSFYVALRLQQTVDETNYRTLWRFDNLRVVSQ